MAKTNKTKETAASVTEFIHAFVEQETKKADSFKLIELMSKWSGFKATMWGPSIIGFGSYHYKYQSGHEGDAPIIGFSPRKAAISLYVFYATEENKHLLQHLGKFTMGKVCIYIKKLADIDINTLEQLCRYTLKKHKSVQ